MKIIGFLLSELIMYAFAFMVVVIVHPTIPLVPALVVAGLVYLFSTALYFIINFSAKFLVNLYYDRKEAKK